MSFTVKKPGLFTTVQDVGRFGYQALGVPVAGAMDLYSSKLANMLVANDMNSPCLEITMVGPVLHFTDRSIIAITGANFNVKRNEELLPLGKPIVMEKGDLLSFNQMTIGARAYLAIQGDWQIPSILSSFSTYTKSAFGGYNGRSLQKGDTIIVVKKTGKVKCWNWSLSPSLFNYMENNEPIRVLRGNHFHWFTKETQIDFFQNEFSISSLSDRMGYRLKGSELLREKHEEMLTEGVAKGTIQVPTNGEPIILMADAQTTGGYPKIAQIISADLRTVAQKKPGDRLHFTEVSLSVSQNAYKQQMNELSMLEKMINKKWRNEDGTH